MLIFLLCYVAYRKKAGNRIRRSGPWVSTLCHTLSIALYGNGALQDACMQTIQECGVHEVAT